MNMSTIDIQSHPLLNPLNLHLETAAMKRLSEQIHRWVWHGATGGIILGESRTGKTYAVSNIAGKLISRDERPIPCHYYTQPHRDASTITMVFRELCISAGLPEKSRDQAAHLADRFLHYMIDLCIEHDSDVFVLLVDEMQRLAIKQLDAFAELHDNMHKYGVRLVVIFVGNDPECWHLLDAIEKDNLEHIRGRFFCEGETVNGLTSKKEVAMCLKQYDRLRYPEDGPTYTAFVLPNAVKQGFKLESLSGILWDCFSSVKREHRLKSWRMKYFLRAVNTLLVDFLPQYGVEDIDEEMIMECIKISGLVPTLVRSVH